MNLQLLHTAADLTSPIVTLEHLLTEFMILERGQLDAWVFRANDALMHFDLARQ